jgi:hypothetical protein
MSDNRNREKQQTEVGVTGGARFVRQGGATPRARGRLSAAVGCTEPTIRGSPAVTATRSARLSQPWQRHHRPRPVVTIALRDCDRRGTGAVTRMARLGCAIATAASTVLAAVDGTVVPRHGRPTAIGTSLSLSSPGGRLRLWPAIGSARRRVVGVAQSRRRLHSQRWPVEPDFRSGGERRLDVGLNAVPRLRPKHQRRVHRRRSTRAWATPLRRPE